MGDDLLEAIMVLDAVPVAAVVVGADRRVRGWNAAAERLYGHRADDAVGEDVVELLFDPDDHEGASARFDAERPAAWQGDSRVRRSDGALLVSSFVLQPLTSGWAWIATDPVDQERADQERSLLQSADHAARAMAEEALGLLESILSAAPVAIAVFDATLHYVRVNDAYAALSGIPAADHPGGRLGEHGPTPVGIVADLRRVLTTGRSILGRPVEFSIGGRPRHFSVSCFPVCTGGELVGAGMAGVEVTQLKLAEAAREASLAEAEAARGRMALIAAASTVLGTTMRVDEQLTRLAKVMVPSAGVCCLVAIVGPNGRPEHLAVAGTDPRTAADLESAVRTSAAASGSPVAEALRSGLPRLLQLGSPAELWAGRSAPLSAGHRAIVAPFEAGDGTRGVLALLAGDARPLGDDDLDLAVEVASRAGLAVGNARAYQQEHEIAETLQRAMLPATVPSLAALDLAVRYVAAADGASVGGDWYDVLPYDDGSAMVVIGDVVGHDIAASTAMGQLRSALRAYAYEGTPGPGEVLSRLERVFERLGLTYATCVVGTFDAEGRRFRFANAGHPPPLLVRGEEARLCEGGEGVMLGVGSGEERAEAEVALEPGDVVVLYTDGLVERRGEPLADGLGRLAATASRIGGAPGASAVCDVLVGALGPDRAALHDDVAILVARVEATPGPDDRHRLAFEPVPEAAAVLRGYTTGVLAGRGFQSVVDTAVLLVSELVTNVVRHAAGPCALTITFGGADTVELAVEDADTRLPAQRSAGPLDEAGRGLLLIEALAEGWGVRRLAGGKATWLTLRRG